MYTHNIRWCLQLCFQQSNIYRYDKTKVSLQ